MSSRRCRPCSTLPRIRKKRGASTARTHFASFKGSTAQEKLSSLADGAVTADEAMTCADTFDAGTRLRITAAYPDGSETWPASHLARRLGVVIVNERWR